MTFSFRVWLWESSGNTENFEKQPQSCAEDARRRVEKMVAIDRGPFNCNFFVTANLFALWFYQEKVLLQV